MRLTDLVAEVPGAELLAPEGGGDVVVSDVVHDSRDVTGGALFCCVRGATTDGHVHAAEAVERGATSLLVDHRVDELDAVPQLRVDDVRAAMPWAAAACAQHPSTSLTMVGVTGTNGKTTTTAMLGAILRAAGRSVEVLGTLSGARTTPESTDLQRMLAHWRDAGVDSVAMEVSSHAIDLHRVDAMRFDVAVFTNLGRDHLDWHGSMEEYFEVKARLFTPEHALCAVVNLDDVHGRLLHDAATIPTVGFTMDEVDDLDLEAAGTTFTWRGQRVVLSIGGSFNVLNALAAAHAASVLGIGDATIAAGLSTPLVVDGRFERIALDAAPFDVVVDFAHTPDGLEQVLSAAGDLVAGRGRVIVVFGCGGDRDASKRPLMGAAAARRADVVIVTADNSRSEATDEIIAEIVRGHDEVIEPRSTELRIEPDRRRAIAGALASAKAGDLVVIAGKGHETTQTIGGTVTPFDDRVVARQEWLRMEDAS